MTQHQAVDDGVRELKPCPWCQQRLELVESWAKSFDPPRLYREYHHRAEPECILGKRLWAFPEDAEKARQAFIAAWNTRALDPVLADMREALERHDAAVATCPIQKQFRAVCPKCKATTKDNCGTITAADYAFVQVARAALSRSERKDAGHG